MTRGSSVLYVSERVIFNLCTCIGYILTFIEYTLHVYHCVLSLWHFGNLLHISDFLYHPSLSEICQCENGYQGDDCSVSIETAPEVAYLSENLYSGEDSDISVISRQVKVYGSGFENTENLSCHVELVEVMDY